METFDGVSISKQDKKSCTLFLQLSTMQTKSGITGVKPTNTELPTPVCTTTEVTISANVQVDGRPKAYQWHKTHGGKIAKCETKVEKGQLKVTLKKSDAEEWSDTFLDYLQVV